MTEPTNNDTTTHPRTPVSIWTQTDDLLKRICAENLKDDTTTHRRSKCGELHHLVVQEAKTRGLL